MALLCHFRLFRPFWPPSVILAVISPKTETSGCRADLEKWSILLLFDPKMGYFCPKMDPKMSILSLILRGFSVLQIRLNIQEGRNAKIGFVFFYVPYPTLGKTGIGMPFLPFLR